MDEDERPFEETPKEESQGAMVPDPVPEPESGAEKATEAPGAAMSTGENVSVPEPVEDAGSQVSSGQGATPGEEVAAGMAGAHQAGEEPVTRALSERLMEESEYDPNATSDDRLLAALSYASQLILPIIVPVILLVSETTKKRPFQRYHAVQSLALSIVLWGLQLALGFLTSIAAATVIGLLCLCFLIPAMIAVWLLPLYYAVQAYGGKRFRIPGLTQFLQDQRWL